VPRPTPAPAIAAARVEITRIGDGAGRHLDFVAVEEPLEIRLGATSISITMRTPGDDRELAAGFLFAESIIRSADDIVNIRHCGPSGTERRCNTIRVELRPGLEPDLRGQKRHFLTSSACGVCGKNSIESLKFERDAPLPPTTLPATVLRKLPEAFRAAQGAFDATGGLHAAALFTARGELAELREDVGRHNAVDKVIGARLLARKLPPSEAVLMVSGRASYELVQKAVVAGLPVLAAVGAPSSLAVSLAKEFGMTLIGFLRGDRFNIYSGEERVLGP
jgi:FdhD protein